MDDVTKRNDITKRHINVVKRWGREQSSGCIIKNPRSEMKGIQNKRLLDMGVWSI